MLIMNVSELLAERWLKKGSAQAEAVTLSNRSRHRTVVGAASAAGRQILP
jgi:hypothetical protein